MYKLRGLKGNGIRKEQKYQVCMTRRATKQQQKQNQEKDDEKFHAKSMFTLEHPGNSELETQNRSWEKD